MDDYLADDERIGRLICADIDPAGNPLTSVPNKARVCTSPRRLWKAGIITQCSNVRGRKVYFVHKGEFADWETAHEVLERNDRKGIDNPHFSDYLDIIKLEKLGLVKYLDEEEWPGYLSQEMATTRHTEGACAIC
mmetsp:Transcript_11374/g.47615  ORF Transcript_11374/g.47615 Transcript_11374/m.47615 type:complete len:135 (-) Transcript_11374:21-425(-)